MVKAENRGGKRGLRKEEPKEAYGSKLPAVGKLAVGKEGESEVEKPSTLLQLSVPTD